MFIVAQSDEMVKRNKLCVGCIMFSIGGGGVTAFVLLDLSVAFDIL